MNNEKNENMDKDANAGKKAPNINPVNKEQVTEDKVLSGEIGGIKPSQTTPKTGGRQGGSSVEDGGKDTGSSAGSR